ncbi:MAG: hypothetical protein FWE13_05225 [Firmicutes bacterium]|nr:hypothetical protein [Bacillota bacterium]
MASIKRQLLIKNLDEHKRIALLEKIKLGVSIALGVLFQICGIAILVNVARSDFGYGYSHGIHIAWVYAGSIIHIIGYSFFIFFNNAVMKYIKNQTLDEENEIDIVILCMQSMVDLKKERRFDIVGLIFSVLALLIAITFSIISRQYFYDGIFSLVFNGVLFVVFGIAMVWATIKTIVPFTPKEDKSSKEDSEDEEDDSESEDEDDDEGEPIIDILTNHFARLRGVDESYFRNKELDRLIESEDEKISKAMEEETIKENEEYIKELGKKGNKNKKAKSVLEWILIVLMFGIIGISILLFFSSGFFVLFAVLMGAFNYPRERIFIAMIVLSLSVIVFSISLLFSHTIPEKKSEITFLQSNLEKYSLHLELYKIRNKIIYKRLLIILASFIGLVTITMLLFLWNLIGYSVPFLEAIAYGLLIGTLTPFFTAFGIQMLKGEDGRIRNHKSVRAIAEKIEENNKTRE